MNEISSFLLSIVESSDDAIIGLNPDGSIVSWNPAAARIYGWSAADIIGMPINRLTLPDRDWETSLIIKRILSGERIRHFQTIHLKKGGIPLSVSLSISPVIDNFERIVGASFIARDLSQQFAFEKNLHELEKRYHNLKASLELAHHIQETLLPPADDRMSGLDIHVRTLYSEAVGGDYYDFFYPASPDAGRFLGLVVGDVSGHGTGAALLMAMAKGALQAEVEHFPYDLVSVMSRLNQFFWQHAEDDMFMTLFMALVDMRSRLLSWCSAGQGPVYLYHSQEQYFEELGCTGTPLGVLDNGGFECQSTELKDDDILIVGTDGIWQARNLADEMFSVERFRQVLATWHHKKATDICERMLSRVKKFTSRDRLDDDATLMIVKVPGRD